MLREPIDDFNYDLKEDIFHVKKYRLEMIFSRFINKPAKEASTRIYVTLLMLSQRIKI